MTRNVSLFIVKYLDKMCHPLAIFHPDLKYIHIQIPVGNYFRLEVILLLQQLEILL